MTKQGRPKPKKTLSVLTNARKRLPRLHKQLGIQYGITRVAASQGRVTTSHRHVTRTRAGATKPHPIQTKQARRARAKAAAASRRRNRQ